MIPKHSNNSITHFFCKVQPLFVQLQDEVSNSLGSLSFPKEFDGTKLSFLEKALCTEPISDMVESVPSWFWLSEMYYGLPINKRHRRNLCKSLYDLQHTDFCRNEEFHVNILKDCICKFCLHPMERYHSRFCKGGTWLNNQSFVLLKRFICILLYVYLLPHYIIIGSHSI